MSKMGSFRHPEEEVLERYATQSATDDEAEMVEEHLLICERCRQRLDEIEEFATANKRAAAAYRAEERRSRVVVLPSRIVWTIAAGLALLGAVLVHRTVPGFTSIPAVRIGLEATRGPMTPAPAGKPLQLSPDLSGLAASDRYLLEVVDAKNKVVWEGSVRPDDPQATITPQSPGAHFVRVYSPSRELLREYGLQVGK